MRIHPAVAVLAMSRWDTAYRWILARTRAAGVTCKGDQPATTADERAALRKVCWDMADDLYARGSTEHGRLALCWLMLAADPRYPATLWPVMPALQWVVDEAELDEEETVAAALRLTVWWKAAAGESTKEKMSLFALAADLENQAVTDLKDPVVSDGPGVVVMPKAKASKLKSEHAPYKDLVGVKLPLVVARDVAGVRRTLLAEYPHAAAAIDLVLRDLREGEPVRLKPMLLVGPPGNGKSRLIRRLGDLLGGIGVFRFDGGSSADAIGYGGTPRGWSDSTPCVPARAVQTYRQANPIVMVDELEKACANTRNGALWHVLLQHLERETAARMRDVSLDAEMDLSWVNHLATANSTDGLPAPLRDRYRIVKVPAPALDHLPALAGTVLREIAAENGEQGFVQPLAGDELDVIAKAWQRAGFSIRKLQKIVAATVEARDAVAMRH